MTSLEFISKTLAIDYIDSLAPITRRIRHIIDFMGKDNDFISEAFKDYVEKEHPENVTHDVIGPASWLIQLDIPKDLRVFAHIYSEEDLEALSSIKNPIDAIVFYYTNNNFQSVMSWYKRLLKSDIEVLDFVNIKIRPQLIDLSEDQKEVIYNDYLSLLKDNNYYYDPATDEVYSQGKFPLKGIRSLRKWLFRYSYGENYANCEEAEENQIFPVPSRTHSFSREQLREYLKNSVDEMEYPNVGFKCPECDKCELHGECSKYADTLIDPTEDDCKLARFNFIPISILKELDIPDSIKEQLIKSKKLA